MSSQPPIYHWWLFLRADMYFSRVYHFRWLKTVCQSNVWLRQVSTMSHGPCGTCPFAETDDIQNYITGIILCFHYLNPSYNKSALGKPSASFLTTESRYSSSHSTDTWKIKYTIYDIGYISPNKMQLFYIKLVGEYINQKLKDPH